MRRSALAATVLAFSAACASAPSTSRDGIPSPPPPPILRLVGRFGVGHGCPISPTLALTAAHYVVPAPFSVQNDAYPTTWATADGRRGGRAEPLVVDNARDLAVIRATDSEFPAWYALADGAPEKGTKVYYYGLRRSADRAFAEELVPDAEVLELIGLHFTFRPSPRPGASGGCLVDSATGRTVGVVTWGDFSDRPGGATWGLAAGAWRGALSRLLEIAQESS